MLPIIARILEERSQNKDVANLINGGMTIYNAKSWKGLRSSIISAHKPAVRAMLLYPTNTLVEDQISED